MAQPELKRVKTSRAVVEYIHREIFDGRLRSGDRIDVERISTTLGVSPTPVREALVLLERDGVISKQVHRAAFVEHFDARTLRADFHVLGLLSGVTVARIAHEGNPAVMAELADLLERLEGVPSEADNLRHEATAEILRFQHRVGATPRLRAELHGFEGFLDWAAWQSHRGHDEVVGSHRRVFEAIVAGNERQASQARLADARAAGESVIRQLITNGVLSEPASSEKTA